MVYNTTLRQFKFLFRISNSDSFVDITLSKVRLLRNFSLFELISCSLGLADCFENLISHNLEFQFLFQNYNSHSCRDIRLTKTGRSSRAWSNCQKLLPYTCRVSYNAILLGFKGLSILRWGSAETGLYHNLLGYHYILVQSNHEV